MKPFITAITAGVLALTLASCTLPFGKSSSSSTPEENPSSLSSLSEEALPPSSASSSISSEPAEPDTSLPEGTVNAALDALVALDIDKFNQYTDNQGGNFTLFSSTPEGEDKVFAKAFTQGITCKLGETRIDGDNATVEAQVTNTDLTGVIGEFTSKAIGSALTGKADVTDYLGELTAAIEDAVASGKTVTQDVTISLIRKDGTWKVTLDEKLLDAVCGGMLSSVESLANLFGGWE